MTGKSRREKAGSRWQVAGGRWQLSTRKMTAMLLAAGLTLSLLKLSEALQHPRSFLLCLVSVTGIQPIHLSTPISVD